MADVSNPPTGRFLAARFIAEEQRMTTDTASERAPQGAGGCGVGGLMKSFSRHWLSLVWRGNIQWVQRNLWRKPKFYGITLGWVAIGVTVFWRDK